MDYHYTQDRAEDRDSWTPAFRSRPNTELIVTRQETPGSSKRVRVKRIDQLFECLENDTDIARPADTIYLVSHGAARGWLGLHLVDVDGDKKDESSVTYETLEAAIEKGITLIGLNTIGPNTKVHLVACNVGNDRTIPYLIKLKEVFNNQVPISASKHLYSFLHVNGAGRLLYLKYDFELFVKKPFEGPTARADLIQAFLDKSFELIALSIAIPTEELWKKWIPEKILPKKQTVHHWINFDPPLKDDKGKEIKRRHESNGKFISNWQKKPFTLKEIEHDMKDHLKNLEFAKNHIRNHDLNKSSHPFPLYKRLGFSNLEDMIDGFDWKLTPNIKKKEIKVVISRFMYNVRVPICTLVDPANKDANKLIYNYYPFENNSHGAFLENLNHFDTDLFQTV